MSKIKKISALVMVIALVICTGYFSSLSPTTAWFYQSQVVNGNNNKFIFADFTVDGEYTAEENLRIDGVTSFKDKSETMFDSVVKVFDVEVENNGGMPARIYSTVTLRNDDTKGFRYFCFAEDKLVDGSVYKTLSGALNGNMTDEALNNYNVGEDGNSGYYELLNPGEKMTFKVAVWVEYDEVDYESLFDGSPWNAADYNILITMNATQDVDGALSR
ncbi:MAG: hypothetical protein IJU45_04665 [Clostridia bacterium]|nr:hypothetical protein [Clostridia bacterium]